MKLNMKDALMTKMFQKTLRFKVNYDWYINHPNFSLL